jgi:hypothetical protein
MPAFGVQQILWRRSSELSEALRRLRKQVCHFQKIFNLLKT